MAYLLTAIDSDRLMAGFKAVSQNVTPTNLYGGWESQNIRGHSMGHWLSAMAHAYQQAQGGSDPALTSQIKTKLDDVISKLQIVSARQRIPLRHACLAVRRHGERGSNNWVPYYTCTRSSPA